METMLVCGTCQESEGHWVRVNVDLTAALHTRAWVTSSIADHLVCAPLFPACWLHTVGVVPAKRTLFSAFGVVYDQRLSLMCNSDDRCLWQPWPDCGHVKGLFSSHLILLISFSIHLDDPDSLEGKESALWSSVGSSC